MMNPPPIFVTPACAPLEIPVPFVNGIKSRRSFCARVLRKSSKGAPPSSLFPQQSHTETLPVTFRRSRSVSPSTRRKEFTSPLAVKRKYLRQVKLPPLTQLSLPRRRKDAITGFPTITTPSTFEQELAQQENESPNDPEFVRRASDCWRRRTGAAQLHQALQVFPQSSAYLQPTFQWPSNPSQQSAFQRRVSPRPIQYPQSPFSTLPTSPIYEPSPFRRKSPQYSSLNVKSTESNFKRGSPSYASLGSHSRSRICFGLNDQSSNKKMRHAARSVSPSSRNAVGVTSVLLKPTALDDSVAEEVRKLAKKERLLANPDDSSLTKPLRRLSARIRRSFRGSKNSTSNSSSSGGSGDNQNKCYNRSSSSSSSCSSSTLSDSGRSSSNSIRSNSSSCSNDNTSLDTSSFTSSTSYQSFLSSSSGYASDCSSSPSSPAIVPRRISSPPIPHPAMALTVLAGRYNFQDIFLDDPQIADKLAIMFPTEPRPEWHRHLRQVINKAGQRIFKKVEPHDTTIPENLRHQLKHIYVY